jgi:7-cyano-7-deazaguanine synthase
VIEAVVLLSGGMDSLVCAAIAATKHQHLAFLHLNYGQKTSAKELECFGKISDHYRITTDHRKIIQMDFLRQIGGSSLTDDKINVKNYDGDESTIPSSYVPFRNSIILSLAVSWAESLGAKHLYIGANFEDSPGYPDCRPEYYKAFNELVRLGTKDGDIHVHTPVIHMKKSEIVTQGLKLKAPFELSWSCYARTDKACGLCDSCALRMRGFKEAHTPDPITYQS